MAGESAGEQVDTARIVGRVLSWPFKVGATGDSAQIPGSSVDSARCDFSNVLVARDVGPMTGEDPTSVGVLLALEDDFVPGSVEAEVESSDAGEC